MLHMWSGEEDHLEQFQSQVDTYFGFCVMKAVAEMNAETAHDNLEVLYYYGV